MTIDRALARAAIAVDTRGIVSAGFAPGKIHEPEAAVCHEVAAKGIVVVQSTRVGSDRVAPASRARLEICNLSDAQGSK